MIIAGIDYSMNSPALTIHDGDTWNISNCKFYYLVQKEKQLIDSTIYNGTLYPSYKSDTERFNSLGEWVVNILRFNLVEKAFLESYSYQSRGRLFEIGENTGLLKYKIWEQTISLETYPPTMIKKFATGKGNSPKDKMAESFFNETGIDLKTAISIKKENPSSDIIDSYYIAKLGFENHLQSMPNVI